MTDKPEITRTLDMQRKQDSEIRFHIPGIFPDLLLLKATGEILVRGRTVGTDIEVVDALREFVQEAKKHERRIDQDIATSSEAQVAAKADPSASLEKRISKELEGLGHK